MKAFNPFRGRLTRVLGMQDVRSLIAMDEALVIQREAFIAHAAGHTAAVPNGWLRLPGERKGWLKLLAGYEAGAGGLGVKVLARFPDNPPGANLGSLLLLFDPESGFPLAVMDGVYITALRTGASAGLATSVLAAPGAATVSVIGTGVVAWYSLLAVASARHSLACVRVFSRSPSRRAEMATRIGRELGIPASPAESVAEALDVGEIVITATNSDKPVVTQGQLRPGQHVNAMGIRTEISADAVAETFVVPDGAEEAVSDGKFSVALAAGTASRNQLGPELGQLLADGAGRWEPGRITLFDSSGVAVQDVVMARHVWQLAEKRDIGVKVNLGLDEGVL
jgi:alanine dehydrogenase